MGEGMAIEGTAPPLSADRPAKPIWHFAILATLIALIWGVLESYGSFIRYDAAIDPARLFGQRVGTGFMSGLLSAAFTWTVFYFLVFRRRGARGRAWFVLFLMIALTGAAGIGAGFVAARVDRERAIEVWQSEARQNFDELGQDMREQLAATGAQTGFIANIHSREDVGQRLLAAQRARDVLENFRSGATRELVRSRQRERLIEMSAEERREVNASLDQEGENLRRLAVLEIQVVDKSVLVLTLLDSHPQTWTVQNDRFVFSEPRVLSEFNEGLGELSSARQQLVEAMQSIRESLPSNEGAPK
ncbi:MAG: hypothetical protein HY054_01375 [Proteobacteria bacterium]|nr:hypothetical protein [Pseudomonadota bacterium]